MVEDELFAREDLKDILSQSNKIEVVGEADGIHKAHVDIQQLEPDVVFLDIHLANTNGIELADKLRSLKNPPFIVFATAFEEYAVKAFELDAADYILKPFDEKRIERTIDKIVKWYQLKKEESRQQRANHGTQNLNLNKLPVVKDDRIILIDIQNIFYFGTENRHVFVKTVDDKYDIDTNLYEIEKKLENYSFLRVHRGCIINLQYVSEIEQWFNGTYNIILSDGSKLPVSRSYAKTVRQYLGF
ncbi:LytR/AlgR family response regulator transcription factor [Neobacillus piezotolerans]|uniref:LytR/AlgR family response regulator transcription factor n=1 Tax=Neobacillus piezotolerans TaxID=2259171 RepID=UPI0015F18ADF|nr:LytTR family DNA-binding domain-containing protein [Neobacillus piezotolerans]